MQQKVAKVSSEITFGKCRVPDPPTSHHNVQGDTQNADFSVCYCYCLTEYTAQLGGRVGPKGRVEDGNSSAPVS